MAKIKWIALDENNFDKYYPKTSFIKKIKMIFMGLYIAFGGGGGVHDIWCEKGHIKQMSGFSPYSDWRMYHCSDFVGQRNGNCNAKIIGWFNGIHGDVGVIKK